MGRFRTGRPCQVTGDVQPMAPIGSDRHGAKHRAGKLYAGWPGTPPT